MDPIISVIVAGVAALGMRVLKDVLDNFVSERISRKSTKEIDSSLRQAEIDKQEKLSPDTLAEIEIFLIKTENKIEYELDDEHLKKQCRTLLEQAQNQIERAANDNNIYLISHSYELIKHVNKLAFASQTSRWYVLGLLLVLIGLLVSLSVVTWAQWDTYEQIVILGIPFPVLLWGAIGSGTAPLYRYLRSTTDKIENPIKLLIIRPFIGMIMGAVIYLIISSGLLIFGGTETVINPQLLWLLAFVGGFSETATSKALSKIQAQISGEEGISPIDEDQDNESTTKGTEYLQTSETPSPGRYSNVNNTKSNQDEIQEPNILRIISLDYSEDSECVEIRNEGANSQLMRGWKIISVKGSQVYTFPESVILESGESIRIHSGENRSAVGPNDLVWADHFIWNNEGDKIELRDSHGNLHDFRTYSKENGLI